MNRRSGCPIGVFVVEGLGANVLLGIRSVLPGVTWRTSSDAKSLVGMRVTPEFFSTFGVPPLRGRPFAASDAGGPPALVISYGFWQRELGGAETVLNSTVTLSDIAYTVVGIMPSDFDVRLLDRPEGAAFWTLFRTGDRGYEPGGTGAVAIVGRLADGVTIETARAEVSSIMRNAESAYPRNFNDFVVNLSSLQADNTRTVRATLLTVLAAALCLLLIASMNVGVLLLGRGLGRRDEVAVRHALGAGRGRLVRQFLTESVVLSACGGALGSGSRDRRNAAVPGLEPTRHPPGQRRSARRASARRCDARDGHDDDRGRPGPGHSHVSGGARGSAAHRRCTRTRHRAGAAGPTGDAGWPNGSIYGAARLRGAARAHLYPVAH